MGRKSSGGGGMGILGVLGIVFGVISWSWWLVLLPFYGGFLLFLLVFSIALWAHKYF